MAWVADERRTEVVRASGDRSGLHVMSRCYEDFEDFEELTPQPFPSIDSTRQPLPLSVHEIYDACRWPGIWTIFQFSLFLLWYLASNAAWKRIFDLLTAEGRTT